MPPLFPAQVASYPELRMTATEILKGRVTVAGFELSKLPQEARDKLFAFFIAEGWLRKNGDSWVDPTWWKTTKEAK